MNRKPIYSNKHSRCRLAAVIVGALMVAALSGCGLRGGKVNPPPAPTNPLAQQPQQPQQPQSQQQQPTALSPVSAPQTEAPAQVTQSAQPTQAMTEAATPDAQGDEVQQMLDQLDKENQSADPLGDVPK